MWYFTWMLGLFGAAIFAVVNAMWLEVQQDNLRFARETASKRSPEAGARHHG